jgi:RNA polymerase sigma-70 factor (ECF subfamily)
VPAASFVVIVLALLATTLLDAWRHPAMFEGRSSFRGWLYRIATNVY